MPPLSRPNKWRPLKLRGLRLALGRRPVGSFPFHRAGRSAGSVPSAAPLSEYQVKAPNNETLARFPIPFKYLPRTHHDDLLASPAGQQMVSRPLPPPLRGRPPPSLRLPRG